MMHTTSFLVVLVFGSGCFAQYGKGFDTGADTNAEKQLLEKLIADAWKSNKFFTTGKEGPTKTVANAKRHLKPFRPTVDLPNNEKRQTEPTTWTDCGGSNASVNSFSVLPNPLSLPGDISLAADLDITEELSSPLKIELDIKLKVYYRWRRTQTIQVECTDDQLGSCTYDDICPILAGEECPPEMVAQGFTCRCPFTVGNHNFMGLTFNLPVEIPWIVRLFARSIEVDITAKVNPAENGETAAACINAMAPLAF